MPERDRASGENLRGIRLDSSAISVTIEVEVVLTQHNGLEPGQANSSLAFQIRRGRF